MTGASPAATVQPVARLEYIDGLRALAALWVTVHHVLETSAPSATLEMPGIGPVIASFEFGQFPVMIFLMLSGFCLYFPLAKKNPARPTWNTTFREYLTRRFTRIAPPYYFAGLFCCVIAAFPELQGGRWSQTVPVGPGAILSHLFFVHNVIRAYSTKIDYPMWSIGLEFQLYLLFPILVLALMRVRGWIVVAACLLLAALIHAVYHRLPEAASFALREGPFSYLEIFATGMMAAALTVRRQVVAPAWLLGCVAVGGLVAVRLGSGNGLAHDLETSAAAFSILLLAANPKGFLARALSAPWLVTIGVFSYSLYLVHAPLLHLAWVALRPLHLSSDATFYILVFAALPPILALSYGFHVLFERPFMRIRPRTAPVPVVVAKPVRS